MRQGLRTLSMRFRPRFLTLGPTLGPCCRRKMLTTAASLTGWDAALMTIQPKGSGEVIFSTGTSIASKYGCISGPEILPPAVKRLPCPSAGGQHCGSLLHKSPGQTAITCPGQGPSTRVSPLTDSAALADQSVVLRSNSGQE